MKKELDEELEEDLEKIDDLEEVEEDEEEEKSKLEWQLVSEEPALNLDFNTLDFSQFTSSVGTIDSGSPILENIESRIDTPGFVSMGTSSFQSGSTLDSSGGDTYLTSQGQGSGDDGVKYIQSGGELKTNVERVDMQSLGRDVPGLNIPQPGNFFISSESGVQPRNEHVGMQPERVDMQNIGRKNPLEREKVKYDESKEYEA